MWKVIFPFLNIIYNGFDIRDYINGPWIASAKNIVYNSTYNVLCADLRTDLIYGSHCWPSFKQFSHDGFQFDRTDIDNYHYKRDCVDLSLHPNKQLDNQFGKFVLYTGNMEYTNIIRKIIGLENYTIEYFPAGGLCIEAEYEEYRLSVGNYKKSFVRVHVIREFCTSYNSVNRITFRKSNYMDDDGFELYIDDVFGDRKKEFMRKESSVIYKYGHRT
jgi:hypothetical protein